MGKGGGGSLGDSESTLWSLAINTHFLRCYAVTVWWAARMGGMISSHPWHMRCHQQWSQAEHLRCYVYISRVCRAETVLYQQLSLQEMDCYSCYSQVRTVLFSVSPEQYNFNSPTAPSFYESYDKWHQRLGNDLHRLEKSAVLPNSSTHPPTQPRPPTTDSCESLQRVMGCKWVNPTLPRLSLITRLDSCRGLLVFTLLQHGAVCLRVQRAPTPSQNWALFLSPPLTAALSQYWPNNAAQAWSRVVSRYCTHSRLLRLVGGYRAFVALLFLLTRAACAPLCYRLPIAASVHMSCCFEWVRPMGYTIISCERRFFINMGSVSSWSLQEKAWYQSTNTGDETRVEDYKQEP